MIANKNNDSLGFAFGPLCWAPISELWGRRMSLLPPMLAVGLFSIGTATSKNIQSLLITRYFGGLFASSPVSNVGAIMGDIWKPKVRGTAVVFYALCVVGGPTLVSDDSTSINEFSKSTLADQTSPRAPSSAPL